MGGQRACFLLASFAYRSETFSSFTKSGPEPFPYVLVIRQLRNDGPGIGLVFAFARTLTRIGLGGLYTF